ncbi:MAG TPA: hypothetical protein VGR74_14700 [Actinomycetota bacterium]|nr:hypothetical protein [Actinomycetota bacterium]
MNLGQLNSAVLAALNRQQDPQAVTFLPVWRAMAESDIFATLRAGWMVRRGGAIFSNAIETLPPSIIRPRGVTLLALDVPADDVSQLVDGNGNPIVWEGSPEVIPGSTITPDTSVVAQLRPLGPDQVDAWAYASSTTPTGFVVEGMTIRLLPWVPPNAWVDITYYSSGKPLELETDFNETLSRVPSTYFYGMLKHAAIFYGDADGEQRWTQQMEMTIAKVNATNYSWQGTGLTAVQE